MEWVTVIGDPDPVIVTGACLDSRRVRPGDLYFALAGAASHGARFAGQAIEAGAVAILTDVAGSELLAESAAALSQAEFPGIPVVVVASPRAILGTLSARIYSDPATELAMIAVTGTQGKTTTTRLAGGILEECGIPAGVVGTVGTRIAGREVKTALTTPEAPDLQAMFAAMVGEGVQVCAMEVSSHALVLGRADGIVFDVAVFTNLGRDHLDFHTDTEDYYQAKAGLFTPERCRLGVVNIDDEHGRRLAEQARIPIRTLSVAGPADWQAVAIEPDSDHSSPGSSSGSNAGSSFEVLRDRRSLGRTRVKLAGEFNVANALAAIAALTEAGFPAELVVPALAAAPGVPGRLERVEAGQRFLAVVDYAHKPDAVMAVLEALRPAPAHRTGEGPGGSTGSSASDANDSRQGRLIIVLGAGGDRDRGKRPIMGDIASRLADIVIVTDDNPRSEDPAQIRAEMLAGMTGDAQVREIADRAEAIAFAVGQARPIDTVVIAGKGNETGQEIKGVTWPFDDREVLRQAILDSIHARGDGTVSR